MIPFPSLSEALAGYVEAWNAAGVRWDCDGLADCFTRDGLFFGGRPEHSIGREAIGAYFRSYTGIILSCTVVLREQQFVPLTPDSFAAQGHGDFSFVLGDGKPSESTVRTTLILVRQPDRWRARLQQFTPPPPEPPLGRKF